MLDALVLSGGASHGDFEVGAVRRLFEAGFQPALIVAASVGSINAIKLCEMGTLAVAGEPSGLEQIWLGLQNNSSMYTNNQDFDVSVFNQSALDALNNVGLSLKEDYTWRLLAWAGSGIGIGSATGGPAGAGVGLVVGLLSSIVESGSDLITLKAQASALEAAFLQLLRAQSMYTLDPIQKLLFTTEILDPDKVKNSPIRLLMAVVSLESGDLRYVTGSGAVMQEDTTTPYSEAYSVDQICQNYLGSYNTAVADLRDTEASRGDYTTFAEWHTAVLNAQAAVATAQAALGACMRANPGPVTQPVSGDVRTGALASASIPMIFIPTQIGSDNYVDGGTRNQVPITGAIAAGATTIWAIDCNQPRIWPATDPLTGKLITSFNGANFLQIAERAAAQILPYQLQLDEDAAVDTRSATVTLVQPELDIDNSFTVDPGLIRIRVAHGYMRTDDVMLAQLVYGDTTSGSVNAISAALHTTDIIKLRYNIWTREHAVVGWTLNMDPDLTVTPPTAPEAPSVDQQALADVRQMKEQLQQLVAARANGINADGSLITANGKQLLGLFGGSSPGGRIPEQPIPASTWWLQWEAHQPSSPESGNVAFSAVAPQLWDANTPFTPLPLPGPVLEFVGPPGQGWKAWDHTEDPGNNGWTIAGDPVALYSPDGALHIIGRGFAEP